MRQFVLIWPCPSGLTSFDRRLDISSLLDDLVGTFVQAYFAYRIHILSGKWTVSIISWIGSFCAIVVATVILVLQNTLAVEEFAVLYSKLETAAVVLLVAVDLINTVALCTYLKIGKTGHQGTDHVLNKLFLWTIRESIRFTPYLHGD